jgi:hypothetical protein
MVAPSNKRFLLESDKGIANGLATHDGSSKIPAGQLPNLDSIVGAAPAVTGKVSKGELVFNVKDYGAVGNGVADDYAAILAAMTAAGSAGGGVVYFPPGTYKRASGVDFDLPSGVRWKGAGSGSTKILQAIWNGTGLVHTVGNFNQGAASWSALLPLTVDVARQSNTLTVSSTAGILRGDLLWIGRPDVAVGGDSTIGEFIRVKSVDSGTQITIWGHLGAAYSASNSGIKTTGLFKNGVGVAGMTFVNTAPDTTSLSMLMFNGCVDVTIDDVVIQGCGYTGLGLKYVYGATVSNVHCYDQPDKTGVSDGSQRFGYGVATFHTAQDIRISDTTFTRVRHGFTTNGNGARNITLSNCTATETTGPAFDTHPSSYGVLFSGCAARNCTHAAFQLRGWANVISGALVENCAGGVYITADARGAHVRNSVFRNLGGMFSPSGSTVAPGAGTFGWGVAVWGGTDYTIDGNTFENLERSAVRLAAPSEVGDMVSPATMSRVDILNNRIINPGKSGQYRFGVLVSSALTGLGDIHIVNNLVGAYATETGEPGSSGVLDNMVYFELAAAAITGKVLVRNNTLFGTAGNFFAGTGSTSTNIINRLNFYLDRADFGLNDVEQFGGVRFGGDVTVADGKAIIAGTSSGMRVGTASTQKLGFFGAPAIVRPTGTAAAATDAATTQTLVNDLRAKQVALGLIS